MKQHVLGLLMACTVSGVNFTPAIAGDDAGATKQVTGQKDSIAPYRKNMLRRIAENWHPKTKNAGLTVELRIDKSGKLVDKHICKSSGIKEEDELALNALSKTEFEPLPDFVGKNSLSFKIDLQKTAD